LNDKLLSGRRILVVEDEMLILLMIEDMLADLGCESVMSAATVDRALALIDSQKFDAAMLDVNLNGEKSFPVADTLVARGVPFLFSTGYSEHVVRESYRDQPILTKPIQSAELGQTLEGLLSHSACNAAIVA
jgi:CheY-like chemotaxis protein